MGKKDPRIDRYIRQSAEFAKPILQHLRQAVHVACPEVVETVKWGMPYFEYNGMLCHMAAFKEHCAFGFWKGALLFADRPSPKRQDAMGHFGRLSSLSDLPDDRLLVRYIKEAARLNERGIQRPKPTRLKKQLVVPSELIVGLRKNSRALATFEKLSPSHKREYVNWIAEGKREETRRTRVKKAIDWMAAGKTRNWKYR